MTTLAFISLAAPLMLLGIAAVALPIAAHLMNRRTRQRLVFPTIRLLTESRATQSSLYRIRRWILLILRCLALILIALAFAMPSCSPKAQIDSRNENNTQGAAVVFILDVSVSLDRNPQTTGGTSLATTLRAVAERTLASLEPGVDRVNVIFAGARPQPLFPYQKGQASLSANHDAVREGLKNFELTYERADLPAALATAGDMLRDTPSAGQRRVVIVSDMQQSNWRDVSLNSASQALLPTGTVITILPLQTGDISNIALSDCRAEPVRPVLNQQAMLITKATNFSNAMKDVAISAMLDGQPIGTRAIQLNPRESREVAFETTITTPGPHRVEFSLPDDALSGDNRAFLAVNAVQRVLVLVVGDDEVKELGSASYFITRALSPRGDRNDLIEVRHITSADLADADTARAEAIFIGQINRLSGEACAAIVQYLHRGGGVVLYSGDRWMLENMNALQAAASALPRVNDAPTPRVVPWTPMLLRDLGTNNAHLRITQGEWNSPLLLEFDERTRAALMQIRFGRVWSMAQLNPSAKVLLTFNDESPALAVLPVGEGRLVVANFSPALSASDIGKHGSFVALSHSLARYIRPQRDWASHAIVGAPIVANVTIPVGEAPGRFVIEGPQGKLFTPDLSRNGSRMTAALDRALVPGFYRILRNDLPAADIAINLDPRESDLRALDDAAIAGQLKSPEIQVEVKGQAAEGDVLQVRGEPLWHWFVIAAMGMIGLELLLLAVWNR